MSNSAVPQASPGFAVNPSVHLTGASSPSRQQRRALERGFKNGAEKIAAELARDQGFEPDQQEVAKLIGTLLTENLIAPAQIDQIKALADALADGNVPPAVANAALVQTWRDGPAIDRALDLLRVLYGPETVLEIRALDPKGGWAVSLNGRIGHEHKGMADFLRQHGGLASLYVSINPRKGELVGTTKTGNSNDVTERRYALIDLDNKDAPASDPDWTRTVERLQGLGPAMVTQSGNGWHVWVAIEPQAGEAVDATQAPLAAAMAALGADNMSDPARIIRIPYSINIPTKVKRSRGGMLALCRVVGPVNPNAAVYPVEDLCRCLHDIAKDLNLPGRKQPHNSGTARIGKGDRLPREKLRAPSFSLLAMVADNLPNHESADRDYQIKVAHAIYGASRGTAFEAEAREKFLEWSSRYWAADPAHDVRLWDGIRDTGSGFPHLLDMLKEANRPAWDIVQNMLAPILREAVRNTFKDAPFDPAQAHLIPPREPTTAGEAYESAEHEPKHGGGPGEEVNGLKGEKPHERAIRTLTATGSAVFPDQNGTVFVKLNSRNHNMGAKNGQRAVLGWLTTRGISLTGNSRSAFLEALEDRAFAEPARKMHYRQADGPDPNSPEAFINLMDGAGTGVQVDRNGWRVGPVAAFPMEMADRDLAEPLPFPVRPNNGGDDFFDLFGRHVPLHAVTDCNASTDQGVQQRASLLCFLLAQYFRPGAVPHLLVTGGQGSGKTSFARRNKGITDPDTADVVSGLPADEGSIYAFAGQQTSLVLDNLSEIKPPHSDVLCLLSTAGAHQKRQLYTNNDRVVSKAKCSVQFTSIHAGVVWREDLLDRTLTFHTATLDPARRRPEAELNAQWEQDLPAIFGALLDLLSGGLARLPQVRAASGAGLLPPLPRIADAALLAEAAAQSMGWPAGLCISALNAARLSDSEDQLDSNPVAYRVRELVRQGGGKWSGSATDLRGAIVMMDGPDWGRNVPTATTLGHTLGRIAEPMRQVFGISVVKMKRAGGRVWEITGPASAGEGAA